VKPATTPAASLKSPAAFIYSPGYSKDDPGRVPKWTNGSDCKSDGFKPSQVRILPRPFPHKPPQIARVSAFLPDQNWKEMLVEQGLAGDPDVESSQNHENGGGTGGGAAAVE
jgi:hypothetical protein